MKHRTSGTLKTLDERGVASLIITMVTMVIISLIVIGFATISRREQRQSLDQQLSTQAFYAAESGVEDAKNVIKSMLAQDSTAIVPEKTDCTSDPNNVYPTGDKMIVNAEFDVSYTCLTVDPNPKSVQFNGVGEQSIIVPIHTALPITSIRMSWTPTSQTLTPATSCPLNVDKTLRQQPNWDCGYGILRTDLTPTSGPLNRTSLVNNSVTSFFEPTRSISTGTIDYNASKVKANLSPAKCDTAGGVYGKCVAIINNITGGTTSLSLRLSSQYQRSNITIEALDGTSPQKINGVQAKVDVTGKASDVLRRIQVRLPVIAGGKIPNYAIQSNSSLCKHFATTEAYIEISGIIDPDPGNAMCQPIADGAIPQCQAYNDVAFVLDDSGSMQERWVTGSKIDRLKAITNNFIQNIAIAPNKNHGAVVTFSGDAQIDQPLTDNPILMTNAVSNMGGNGNGTNYFAALTAVQQVFASPLARPTAKKVIIFMSDGEPNKEVDKIVPTTDQLKAAGVIIYTIGISKDLGQGRQILTDMAGNGGRFGDAALETDLEAILNSIIFDVACTGA